MTDALIQIALALFGLGSIYMSQVMKSPRALKWSPVVGLCGQPFWFAFAWQVGGWGVFILVCAYTFVYARGVHSQWARSA